jgi:hypothetical protein
VQLLNAVAWQQQWHPASLTPMALLAGCSRCCLFALLYDLTAGFVHVLIAFVGALLP